MASPADSSQQMLAAIILSPLRRRGHREISRESGLTLYLSWGLCMNGMVMSVRGATYQQMHNRYFRFFNRGGLTVKDVLHLRHSSPVPDSFYIKYDTECVLYLYLLYTVSAGRGRCGGGTGGVDNNCGLVTT